MSRLSILIFLLLIISRAKAVEIEFIGPCSDKPLLSADMNQKFETVGDLTVHVLNKNRVSYQGNEQGINSAFGTPVGLDALEVLSDTDMRSYGWCYFVDGELSTEYADVFYLESHHKKIQWIYSYAHFHKNGWTSMCEKAYLVKPQFLCKK